MLAVLLSAISYQDLNIMATQASGSSQRVSLDRLPPEILSMVADRLKTSDLLRLRLTNAYIRDIASRARVFYLTIDWDSSKIPRLVSLVRSKISQTQVRYLQLDCLRIPRKDRGSHDRYEFQMSTICAWLVILKAALMHLSAVRCVRIDVWYIHENPVDMTLMTWILDALFEIGLRPQRLVVIHRGSVRMDLKVVGTDVYRRLIVSHGFKCNRPKKMWNWIPSTSPKHAMNSITIARTSVLPKYIASILDWNENLNSLSFEECEIHDISGFLKELKKMIVARKRYKLDFSMSSVFKPGYHGRLSISNQSYGDFIRGEEGDLLGVAESAFTTGDDDHFWYRSLPALPEAIIFAGDDNKARQKLIKDNAARWERPLYYHAQS